MKHKLAIQTCSSLSFGAIFFDKNLNEKLCPIKSMYLFKPSYPLLTSQMVTSNYDFSAQNINSDCIKLSMNNDHLSTTTKYLGS